MTDELLSDEQIEKRLEGSAWKRDGQTIVLDHEFENFQGAVDAVTRIARAAEAANHHPDLLIHDYNKLQATLTSHSAGGLTAADFDLAGQIDMLLSGPQEAG